MLCDLRIAELEAEREKKKVWTNKSEDLLLCRSRHICCQIGEGQRTFAQAWEERFAVRDMAMLADHNNFMVFDIDNEADALFKLDCFARYVL